LVERSINTLGPRRPTFEEDQLGSGELVRPFCDRLETIAQLVTRF
jgi:hypothetical protein